MEVGLVAAGLMIGCGWPFWRNHTAAAVTTALVVAVLAVSAALLMGVRRSRLAGFLFLGAAGVWALSWIGAWNSGPLPLVGELALSAFYFCTGLGTISYPGGGLRRLDRLWALHAALTLGFTDLTLVLVNRPEWLGYAPEVWWPHIPTNPSLASSASMAISVGYFALAASFILVLGSKARTLGRRERALIVPVLFAASLVALLAAVVESGPLGATPSLEEQQRVLVLDSLVAAAIPIALFSSELRRRWHELVVGLRVLQRTHPATASTVRAVLSDVLDDKRLDLAVWLPEQHRFVDTEGRLLPAVRPGPAPGRQYYPVSGQDGLPLAVLDLADGLVDEPLAEVAVAAAGSALVTSQVQASLLEQVRAGRQRLVEAEAASRARLERDLHDGAQQRLLAIGLRLGQLEATAEDEDTRRLAHQCRVDLLDGIEELRALAQGIHPSVLSERGVGAALEAVARRLDVPIKMDVPTDRFPPAVESTAYFVICEALTNAVRHAAAGTVLVRLWTEADLLLGEVRDDGSGGAVFRQGGGLAGIADRVNGLRGRIGLDSRAGAGTVLSFAIPYE
jgi:signal transduction histidine kinase